jgi:hypothetical protein
MRERGAFIWRASGFITSAVRHMTEFRLPDIFCVIGSVNQFNNPEGSITRATLKLSEKWS